MYFPIHLKANNVLPDYQLPRDFVLEKRIELVSECPLIYEDRILYYQFEQQGQKLKIYFDFNSYFHHWHKTKPVKSKEILAKAIGLKTGETLYDLTCGTGKDSSLFLYWGLKVVAYERNPLVYLLLLDALERLKTHEKYASYLKHFSLSFGDGENLPGPSVTCYFDPMFGSEKTKDKAKSRKEMEFFKKIVGTDMDAREKLEDLISSGHRVILKRPDNVVAWDRYPHQKWIGKTIEYWRFN